MGVGPSFPPRAPAASAGSVPLQYGQAITNTVVTQNFPIGVNTAVNLGPAGRNDIAQGFTVGAGANGPITNSTGNMIVCVLWFSLIVRKTAAGTVSVDAGIFVNGVVDPNLLETGDTTSPGDPDTLSLSQIRTLNNGDTVWPYIRSGSTDDIDVRGNCYALRIS